jgi:hypothetical protein
MQSTSNGPVIQWACKQEHSGLLLQWLQACVQYAVWCEAALALALACEHLDLQQPWGAEHCMGLVLHRHEAGIGRNSTVLHSMTTWHKRRPEASHSDSPAS